MRAKVNDSKSMVTEQKANQLTESDVTGIPCRKAWGVSQLA